MKSLVHAATIASALVFSIASAQAASPAKTAEVSHLTRSSASPENQGKRKNQ